jgi:hypothetical protein
MLNTLAHFRMGFVHDILDLKKWNQKAAIQRHFYGNNQQFDIFLW